jgi:hypothetical protein
MTKNYYENSSIRKFANFDNKNVNKNDDNYVEVFVSYQEKQELDKYAVPTYKSDINDLGTYTENNYIGMYKFDPHQHHY